VTAPGDPNARRSDASEGDGPNPDDVGRDRPRRPGLGGSRRGWLGLVLGRIGEDRVLVAAAWLTILIATTAMVASAMRSDAVARTAILQVLAAASATESALEVAISVLPEDADVADATVRSETARALGSAAGTVWASGRSDGYRLAGLADREIVVFGFAEGLDAHATLVAGDWPPVQADADGTVVAAVSAPLAARLGLAVGDRLNANGRGVDGDAVAVRIGGIYEVDDPADLYWWGDPLALTGSEAAGGFTTVGPLMVDRALVVGPLTDIWAAMSWRTEPRTEAFDPSNVGGIAGGLQALGGRLDTDLGRNGAAEVATALPDILSRASSGTRTSGSGILLLDGQVIVLGGYALIMVAAMVVERRRGSTAVLRVRGATTWQLLRLTTMEAIVLVVPATILAPVLAAGLLTALDVIGPAGVTAVAPRLTSEAVVLAVVAAIVAIVGMAIPVLASSGPIASVRRSVGRQVSRTAVHRTGLDLAFVAFAAIVLWELRANGAPISASFRGTVGIDPLLVAAPAIGLAAGAVLTMRIVPVLATWLERAAARRSGVVAPMATRSIARRPSRYSRSALLIVVAVAIAFLAATYERTWRQSQLDQVALAVPVDVVARPPASATGPEPADAEPMAVARAAYQGIEGVEQAAPLIQQAFDLRRPEGRGDFLAIVPELAIDTVDVRSDLTEQPFDEQLAAMIEARPSVSVVPLPADAASLRLSFAGDIAAVAAGPSSVQPDVGPIDLDVSAVVRDATGILYRSRVRSQLRGGEGQAEIPLAVDIGDGTLAALDGPLELLAVELSGRIPAGTRGTGSARLTGIEAASDQGGDGGGAGAVWTPVDWQAVEQAWTYARVLAPRTDPVGAVATDGPPATVSLDTAAPAGLDDLTLTLGPRELAGVGDLPLPALATRRLTSLAPPSRDGVVALSQGFADTRHLSILGLLDVVPTLDPAKPAAIVDLPSLQLGGFARTGSLSTADAWWLSLAPGADATTVAASLGAAGHPLEVSALRASAVTARTGDPFQAGVTGVLSLVAGAALLFAIVGLAISLWYTVSSRQGEFAVARALGLGRRQLLGWLAIESAFLIIVGLVGGLLVGLVLAWVVMPSITLTTEGRPPIPSPVAVIAWDLVVTLIGLGAAAFGLSVLAARRAVSGVRVAASLRASEVDR